MNPMKMLGKEFGNSIGNIESMFIKMVELQEKQNEILGEIRDAIKEKDNSSE